VAIGGPPRGSITPRGRARESRIPDASHRVASRFRGFERESFRSGKAGEREKERVKLVLRADSGKR